MKIPIAAVIFLVLSCCCQAAPQAATGWSASPNPWEESLRAQLEALELGGLLSFGELLESEYREYLPGLSWKELISGGLAPAPRELLGLLLANFFREFRSNLYLLRQLAALGIFIALLQQLTASFGSKSVVSLGFGVCFVVFALLALKSFQSVLAAAAAAVDHMVSFMQSLLPTLSALLAAVGGISSATLFHPLLWALVSIIASLVNYLLLPLILFGAAFSLVSHFAEELPFSGLGGLLRQGVITILGALFIVFSGFLAVKGAIAPIADGVSLRAAKYLTKTFIPVAGGMFADAVEAAAGGSLLIKNGVGVFGLAMIMFMVAAPLLKIWAMIFIYKLLGVFLEPICDPRLIAALKTMEASLALIFASVGTVALMFLLCISILVGLGNLTMFMR